MSKFTISLNGEDFTAAFNKWGVSWEPVKIFGPNQGTSMAGSAIVDLVAVKDCMVLQGNDILRESFSKLQQICAADYVTAVFPHPATGETVTKVMMPTLSTARRKPMHGGRVYLSGWTLTLEER